MKISELFGVELKLLLVLAGYLEGEAGKEIQPPLSEAERMIDESLLETRFKSQLRAFWFERMEEEQARLRDLLNGVHNAISPMDEVQPTELEPWLEKALETDITKHVQRLRNSLVHEPQPYTWFVYSEGGPRESLKRLRKSTSEGAEVSQNIFDLDEGVGYYPLVECERDGWAASTEMLDSLEEARAALEHFFNSNHRLMPGELVIVDASEEEG